MGSVFSIAEVHANGSDTNSGFFDPNATFTQTLSATSANTASPVVTASNYTFVSNDVGHYLFIKPSGVWNCGWYRIVSVNAGAATIDASVGNVFTGDQQINTFLGVATTSTASSGFWGIDYTQKNTLFISYTDLSIVGVQYGLQSAANPFTPNLIGNTILISSGTNFTTGLYIINSLSGLSAYMDRNVGTVGSTGGVGVLGGALQTAGRATSLGFSYHFVYMKGSSGNFNISSNPYSLSGVHHIIGYYNKRGDNLKPTIKLNASSANFLSSGDGRFVYLTNLIIDGQNYASTRAISLGNNQISHFYNCEFKNLAQAFWSAAHFITSCYFENCSSLIAAGNGHIIQDCIFKNCGGTISGSPTSVDRCVFYNHSANPIRISSTTKIVSNNTFYNITGSGIEFYSNYGLTNQQFPIIINNIFSNVSSYAVNYSNSGAVLGHIVRNNAYYACGGTHFIGQGNNTGVGYYLDTNNVQLTASPFVSASTGDFRLNNEINGGRSCRGAGQSLSYTYLGINSAIDIGAVQTPSTSPDKVIASTSKSVNIKENTTSYSEYVYMASTGYTSSTAGLKAYYIRQNSAPVAIGITAQSPTGSYLSGGFCEVDANNLPGLYRFDVPNAVFSSGVQSTILHIANVSNNDKTMITYKFQDTQTLDLTQAIPTSNTPQTVGDALNAARAQGFGKWIVSGKTLNLYAPDGTTIIRSFTLNSATEPTSRT